MISKMAVIEEGVHLGQNCSIGEFTIVRSGTTFGNNVKIGSHCEIGAESPTENSSHLEIGSDSLIRSHSVIYTGSTFGDRLKTGHRVTIRENSSIGINVQVGTLSDIQGDCVIGDHTRLHSNVHIGKNSNIGSFVWIYPYVVLTNDPHPPSDICLGVVIEDFAVIATMSVVLPGVRIGRGSLIAAHSLVGKDVTSEKLVAGSPARIIKELSAVIHVGDGLPAYPWPRHFKRGYPENVSELYVELSEKNEQ
jgi:acetyltransferase-like isoleucine patch superfamily enzyme